MLVGIIIGALQHIMKKILKTLTIFIMLLVTISLFRVQASSKQYVYLGGDSIGLKMNTGVYVVGKYEVQTKRGKVSPTNQIKILQTFK